ncbi:uncharacterized protein si:dkey-192g7.3 [Myxocyprinus asiaticus]|uniref:uncharacterized protein si:dkey-192g7.3 n=1 Tax=Myxocyprinus asiaticus TaxID=70543 RepID=UPI002222C89C|nr:uncharacterized protein si:dkey-192g7.3 [Myxocyprinus asiaticus]
MVTLALLTLLLIIDGLALGQATVDSIETRFVGQDVHLPCPCSDEHTKLVWQNDDRVVSLYSQKESDKDYIDQSYRDRAQLFQNKEKRNCTLQLLNLSVTDAGLYICYALVSVGKGSSKMEQLSRVNLTVSDYKKTKNLEHDQTAERDTAFSVGVPILIVVLILAVGLLLTLLIRRRHLKNMHTTTYSPSDSMIV